MGEPSIKTRKLSFSSWILIGMAAGVVCGIVFGEYCAFLEIFGNGFIKLLQITILPYILVSLIQGIGGLTYSQARQLAIRAGALLLVFWGIIFAIILLMPLSFPKWVSAAFFSSALVETPPRSISSISIFLPTPLPLWPTTWCRRSSCSAS
jgi:Na+/H+-dicarboxylate symporter